MEFIIDKRRYAIDKEQIIAAVKSVAPKETDGRSKYCVKIEGKQFPIKQPVHLVTGLPYIAFTASYAYRILKKLGFEIHYLNEYVQEPKANYSVVPNMKFAVTIETDEDGFFVTSCPALPGCHSQGRTIDEAVNNITEAIRGYIASMRKHGETIPDITEIREIEVCL